MNELVNILLTLRMTKIEKWKGADIKRLMTIARKSMLKLYFFSIAFYQYSRNATWTGSTPACSAPRQDTVPGGSASREPVSRGAREGAVGPRGSP